MTTKIRTPRPPSATTDFQRQMVVTAHKERVLTRAGDARQRTIEFTGRLCRAEARATGHSSPLVSVEAALREECVWLPLHLVQRREDLQAWMLLVVGAVSDPFTAKQVERLIADLALGLAFCGSFAEQADFAACLADLVAAQMIPYAPEASR